MSRGIAWLLLLVSGVLDVAWAVSMKYTQGYTRPGWTIVAGIAVVRLAPA